MRRYDYLTPIGIVLGIVIVAIGILSGAGLSGFLSFLDLTSFLIVTGGLFAALCVSFAPREIKRMPLIFKQAFKQDDEEVKELVKAFVSLSDQARKEGILTLDKHVFDMRDPFLKKGLMLTIDGWDEETIRSVLDAEIAAMEERHRKGRKIFEKAGEYAPAWGMIGTIVGLVLMLKNLSSPDTLGPSMAVALLTTLYGALLANMFFIPIASKLEEKTEHEIFMKQVMIEGIIGILSGKNPRQLESELSVFGSRHEWMQDAPKIEKASEHSNEA
ncbi:flagellar motor protein MotP [Bacillus sp. NPDC077027]|uniref:flagellar motor protein MotP n=1 Tax=Bacillus sp. NPDC077027 TaxID=3390548 RepID=UPI003D0592F9